MLLASLYCETKPISKRAALGDGLRPPHPPGRDLSDPGPAGSMSGAETNLRSGPICRPVPGLGSRHPAPGAFGSADGQGEKAGAIILTAMREVTSACSRIAARKGLFQP